MTAQLRQQMEDLIRNTISNGLQEFGNHISSQIREMANSRTSPANLPANPPAPVVTAPATMGGRNGGRNSSNRLLGSGFPVRRSSAALTRAVRYFSYLNLFFIHVLERRN